MSATRPAPLYPRSEWREHHELTPDEQAEVVVAAGAGDKSAADYAWHLFGGIVQQYARRHFSAPEEAIADLYEGFRNACRLFDPARRRRFSTYLYWWLRGARDARIRKSNQFGVLRSPKNVEIYRRLMECSVPLWEMTAPMVAEVAAKTGASREAVYAVLLHCITPKSLVKPAGFESAGVLPEREVADDGPLPSDLAELDQVRGFVAQLDPKVQVVLRGRYWDGLSLREVGEQIGCSPEWVRVLEARGLKSLRDLIGEGGEP